MKPVAIFRHKNTEGPAYFATVLERRNLPYRVIKIDAGEAVPADASAYAGLCFMGGPMSVNDDLPWIAQVCDLIRDAVAREVPVLGHCLGGQLIAKALGARVTRNPVKEIGWGRVDVIDGPQAREWLGDLKTFTSYHWHGETFAIPKGATRILSSAHCANQAYVLGPHLGMQCHVEMTPELIRTWCQEWEKEVTALAARVPSVQSPAEMKENMDANVLALHAVADRLYDRWIANLRR